MTKLPEKSMQRLAQLLGETRPARHLPHPLQVRPLVLYERIDDLLHRRHEIWHECSCTETEYGYGVKFVARIKGSHTNPEGRFVSGNFEVLSVDRRSCLLVSLLPSEEDSHGPELLAQRAHPIAARPFVSSQELRNSVQALAEKRGWKAQTTDISGYHPETRAHRRDRMKQEPERALLEMYEQGRRPFSLGVSFRDAGGSETLRAYFRINGDVAVHKGSEIAGPVVYYVIPAIRRFLQEEDAYAGVEVSDSPSTQRAVELTFRFGKFESIEQMKRVCLKIANERGLSVSLVHANPYLHAQVLDWANGAVLTLLILDGETVTLLPRSGDCSRSLQRIATSLFTNVGEGSVRLTEAVGHQGKSE